MLKQKNMLFFYFLKKKKWTSNKKQNICMFGFALRPVQNADTFS